MLRIMKRDRGFTLIELLVVIAIIGILSSVVLASLNSARTKSRDARRISDLQQLQLALELYYDANSSQYPTELADLTPNFIPAIPSDPSTGTYSYAALGSGSNCSSYHLGANLEDVNANQSVLSGDADPGAGTVCSGGGTDFAGTDTGKCFVSDTSPGTACYDLKP